MVTEFDSSEGARLAAVRRYDVLDSPADGTFDRITSLAARLFHVPIAIVSIVDEDRIWFKSHHGLAVEEVSRDPGLCTSAIMQYEPLVIPDAQIDPVALTNPLVRGELGLRFYAGAPLTTPDGHNLGTLCIIDQRPRELVKAEVDMLSDLADLVVDELEVRRLAATVVSSERALRAQANELSEVLQATLLPHSLAPIPGIDVAACYRPAERAIVGGDFYDVFPLPRRGWAIVIGDVCGKGPRAAAIAAAVRYTARTAAFDHDTPSKVVGVVNETMLLDPDPETRFCTMLYARLRSHGDDFHLAVASGGHPLPLVLRRSGQVERLGEFGGLVGAFPEARYSDQSTRLRSGDTAIFFTDGLTEARLGQDLFGRDGVVGAVANCVGLNPSEICERLEQAVVEAGYQLRDDLATVVLRVK